MITDGYWRLELFYIKQRIMVWSFIDRYIRSYHNEHRISREILYSSVVVRKIVDDCKEARSFSRQHKQKEPPLEVMRYRAPLKEYSYTGDDFVTYRVSVEDYDYSKAKDIKMDLDQLCNKVIHSYVWSVVYSGKDVHGVVFASDKEKTDKLYLLKLSDWIDMLQYCIDEACV